MTPKLSPLCRVCRKECKRARYGVCGRCYGRGKDLPRCQHCADRRASRPRQLCHRCYYTNTIRIQYPARANAYAWANEMPTTQQVGEMTPTDAYPGTEDKCEVLAARAAAGLPLHHPDDAQRSLDP